MVNFFYLDINPKLCAQYYCNKHIIKIPIEIGQILSKVHYELKSNIDYDKIYNKLSTRRHRMISKAINCYLILKPLEFFLKKLKI